MASVFFGRHPQKGAYLRMAAQMSRPGREHFLCERNEKPAQRSRAGPEKKKGGSLDSGSPFSF